jgi:hypothetical protein
MAIGAFFHTMLYVYRKGDAARVMQQGRDAASLALREYVREKAANTERRPPSL